MTKTLIPTRLAGMILALSSLASAIPAADYPCWRGPDGSGVSNSGLTLIDDISQARLAWTSDEVIPSAGWDITSITYSGGLNNPVVQGDRVYLTYYEMSGDVIDDCVSRMTKKNRQLRVWPERKDLEHRWKVGADDVVHCFDTATGKTVWKKVFANAAINYNHRGAGLKTGPHMTPYVAAGKLYVAGALMALYCLDAATGDVVWQHPVPEKYQTIRNKALEAKRVPKMEGLCNVHLHVVDDVLVVPCDSSLVGYEAESGRERWRLNLGGKPYYAKLDGVGAIRWQVGDKTFIIIGQLCIDPSTGKVLWQAPGSCNHMQTPVVSGTTLVTYGPGSKETKVLRAFAISTQDAKLLWEHDVEGISLQVSPAVMNGHLFVHGSTRRGGPQNLIALDLATGAEVSRTDFKSPPWNPVWDSLTGGDGLLLKAIDRVPKGMGVFDVRDPKQVRYLGKIHDQERYGWCSTGAYAGGFIYFRSWDHLVCYDLRHPGQR